MKNLYHLSSKGTKSLTSSCRVSVSGSRIRKTTEASYHTICLPKIWDQSSLGRSPIKRLTSPLIASFRCDIQCRLLSSTSSSSSSSVPGASGKDTTTDNDTQDNANDDDNVNTDWIPPNQPLVGDRGKTTSLVGNSDSIHDEDTLESQRLQKEYEALKEEDRKAMNVSKESSTPATVDWMKTRRETLTGVPTLGNIPESLYSVGDPNTGNRKVVIPIKHHTLLTRKEIAAVLDAYGGQDIVTLMDDPKKPRMGGIMGQIIATAPSHRHLGQLGSQLVHELRNRKLQEVGVPSAIEGPQGNPRDPDEVWMLVDCQNYVVHIQTERARKFYKLDYLWSFQDPIWGIDTNDEDVWDDYMANVNPIDPRYAEPATPWSAKSDKLENNRYSAPHRPVVVKRKKRRRTRR